VIQPQRHATPAGWPPDGFERLTDALAAALVGAYRRRSSEDVKQIGKFPGLNVPVKTQVQAAKQKGVAVLEALR
jgi:hypothetical protein